MYKCVAIISLAAVALAGCGDKSADTAATDAGPTGATTTPGTSGSSPATESSPWSTSGPKRESASGSTGSLPEGSPPASSADTAQQTGAHPPDKEMTPKEESESMPKPGQANDYSTTERSNAMGTGSK